MSISISQKLRKTLTFVLWVLGSSGAVAMLLGRPHGDVQGLAYATTTEVSARVDGVLAEVLVDLHDRVTTDQLLATLDPGPLQARINTLEAELRALERSEAVDSRDRQRRFQTDLEDARRENVRRSASLKEEEAKLTVVEAELARERRLVDEGLRARAIAEDLERQAEVIRTRIAEERSRIATSELAVTNAQARVAASGGANQWQVIAARRRLSEVQQQLRNLELRSPMSGQVTELQAARGAPLRPGEPVLRVSPVATSVVHVWSDSRALQSVEVGDPVGVRQANGRRHLGVISSIGAERQLLPQQLWYRSGDQEWGYLIRVGLDEPLLTPGELVRVDLR